MSTTKRNLICWHTLFAVISAVLGAVILRFALPGIYFKGYSWIPVYFYGFGLFSINILTTCHRNDSQRLLMLHLAMKTIKWVISLILAVIYCLAVREDVPVFLLIFTLFYLIYLIFETWLFSSFEVNQKRKEEK